MNINVQHLVHKCTSDQSTKESYMIIPNFLIVVDHSSTKTPSRVDPSSSNRDSG